MPNSLETLENALRTLITVGVRSALLPANDAVVAAAHSSGSVTRVLELEPAPEPPVAPHCLWCHRSFTPRMTGESSKILLHGTQATVLDRGASLDDEGDRGGPTLGRLLEGVSHERARCRRGVPVVETTLIAGAYWAIGLIAKFPGRTLAGSAFIRVTPT